MLRVKLHSLLCITISVIILFIISCAECVEISEGINGLKKVILRQSHGSTAEVYLYGAHVISWKNNEGEELLFVSSKSFFEPPKPIRGGIPLIFPQYANTGPLQSHGFVRNRFWTIDTPDLSPNVTTSFVDLLYKSTEEDLKIWPNSFEYRLRVALVRKGNLKMTARVINTNTDEKPFNFTIAYHNYFSVPNISDVAVVGLENLDYLDQLKNRTRFTDQGDAITFQSEVDKIYLSTPNKIDILYDGNNRVFTLRKRGLPDAVVWNQWDQKWKRLPDFGEGEYKFMVTVEPAAIEKPITLKPGEEWKGWQELSAMRF